MFFRNQALYSGLLYCIIMKMRERKMLDQKKLNLRKKWHAGLRKGESERAKTCGQSRGLSSASSICCPKTKQSNSKSN